MDEKELKILERIDMAVKRAGNLVGRLGSICGPMVREDGEGKEPGFKLEAISFALCSLERFFGELEDLAAKLENSL